MAEKKIEFEVIQTDPRTVKIKCSDRQGLSGWQRRRVYQGSDPDETGQDCDRNGTKRGLSAIAGERRRCVPLSCYMVKWKKENRERGSRQQRI